MIAIGIRRIALAWVAGAVLGFSSFAATATAPVVDASDPEKLIRTASDAMLKDIDAHRAAYRKDKTQLYKLVDDVLLPNFDVNFAAQQVLGKHWRNANEQQRGRFIKAFYHSLLQTYGDALVDFTGDKIKFLPFQGDPAAARATVRTEIRRDGGALVKVNYSLRKTESGWKAWDVVIEGISYVKSFQEDFGPEVEQNGLDSLIQRLETGGSKPAAKRAGA